MSRYSHDNWNQIWDMPAGPEKDRRVRLIGRLVKGNLQWFVRRLVGGISTDEKEWIVRKIETGEMVPRSDFLRIMKQHEDTLGIY